jgi:DNA-binding NtrC family response regulator
MACGSIPETLLESELFGHMKGAFTGADTDKPGKLRAAEGGTLFIDEINSATATLQLKLLRVLQERQFEPVGSHDTHKADVRFVLASNESLEKLVRAGKFREDLYYRINVVNIELPPLRLREGDIPRLAEHFLQMYCRETGKVITGFSEEVISSLRRYRWPGNVRELENAVERAVVLSRQPMIDMEVLPETIQYQQPDGSPGFVERRKDPGGWVPANWTPQPLRTALEEPEKRIILAALQANDWNRQKTAEILDINRTTLYKKIKQYGLEELAATS